MGEAVYKFKRDMLQGKKLHVHHKQVQTSYRKHWHNYYEIIYYRNCCGYCILNGQNYAVTNNCLFLLTPKDFHEIHTVDKPDAQSYVLSFSEQLIADSIFSRITRGPVYIPELPELTADMIQHLHALFSREQSVDEDHLYHLFNAVLFDIVQYGCCLSGTATDMHPIIQESISKILTNPTEPYTLDALAREFHVNPTYYSHLFHKHTGIAFKQYLTMLRVEYGKRLLEERELPIIDVGCECGFNTPSQFIRAFKQLTGMTPSAYRTKAIQPNKI